MAYIDKRTERGRSATIVAVAALHGAAIYALISGLGVDFIKEQITRIDAYNIPDTAPEPPPVDMTPPDEATIQPEFTAPAPDINLPSDPNIVVVRTDDDVMLPEIVFRPRVPEIEVTPTPPAQPEKPAFEASVAKPRGNPGSWFGTSDYPTRDIREGNEGTVRFRVTIDARGKVAECDIVRSSGHPGLDAATCRVVEKRGRFDAAKDNTGAPVSGSFSSSVTWEIPR